MREKITPRVSRRGFWGTVAAATAILLLPSFSPLAAAEPAPLARRPNIIVVLADDLGQECLGCYGGQNNRTPRLDQLAREGVRFDCAFAQPLCTPSRVQLLTGQYNFRNYTGFGFLAAGQATFAQSLKNAGYRTAIVGKWQLAGGTGAPASAGFDNYCLWHLDKGSSRYWAPADFIADSKPMLLHPEDYGPDIQHAYARKFISDNAGKGPFLLYYTMTLPHPPFLPTPHSADRQCRDTASNFKDMVEYADYLVGDLVDHLKVCGVGEQTLLIFTGDNGTPAAINSGQGGGTVKGGKGAATERGTHVPLIVWAPGRIRPGVSDALMDFTDLAPTLADAAQTSLPADRTWDGTSLWPALTGRQAPARQWVYGWYYGQDMGFKNAAWVHDRRWWLYTDGRLYDVQTDAEQKAVAADTPEAREARVRLEKVLAALAAPPVDHLPIPNPNAKQGKE